LAVVNIENFEHLAVAPEQPMQRLIETVSTENPDLGDVLNYVSQTINTGFFEPGVEHDANLQEDQFILKEPKIDHNIGNEAVKIHNNFGEISFDCTVIPTDTQKLLKLQQLEEDKYQLEIEYEDIYSGRIQIGIGSINIGHTPFKLILTIKNTSTDRTSPSYAIDNLEIQSNKLRVYTNEEGQQSFELVFDDSGYPTVAFPNMQIPNIRSVDFDSKGIINSVSFTQDTDKFPTAMKGYKIILHRNHHIAFKTTAGEILVASSTDHWGSKLFKNSRTKKTYDKFMATKHNPEYIPNELIENQDEFVRLIDDLTIDSSNIATIYLAEYLAYFTSDQEKLTPFLNYELYKARVRLLERFLIEFPKELAKGNSYDDVYSYFLKRIKSGLGTDFLQTEEGAREYSTILKKYSDKFTSSGWGPVFKNILDILSKGKSGVTNTRFESIMMSVHNNGFTLDNIISEPDYTGSRIYQDYIRPYRAMIAWHNAREYGYGKLWHYLPQEIKSYIRIHDWKIFLEMQNHELNAPITKNDISDLQSSIQKLPKKYRATVISQLLNLEDREQYQEQLKELRQNNK